MNLERLAYLVLSIVAVIGLGAAMREMAFEGPEGWLGLAALFGLALLFVKALRDRRANKEDDHYAQTVER